MGVLVVCWWRTVWPAQVEVDDRAVRHGPASRASSGGPAVELHDWSTTD